MNKKIFFIILTFLFLPTAFVLGQVTLTNTIEHVRDALIAIGTFIVIIGWVITGILYLTAAGGERLTTAKKSLIACVIGTLLIIVADASGTIINMIRSVIFAGR